MSTSITVRLDDEVVHFVDDLVRRGEASSRSAVVAQALKREQRRKLAERDAAILAAPREDAEMDGRAEFAGDASMDDLD
ncbi:ribbon-helix-helix domain-containing protein [Mumia sp. zg.B53]|uniref:ribbon-helix-helix domain-containing protein n=1 Tax=Mumia sp. zg.B53 TaxID=2855449 RepID=UPI001C6EE8D1|nr:ribbon-helix-helix domain-containing protein [Mumia sp. zg.B53]MBW9214705.1 ribbon-helix-helix domain-containing protein [Mumia sp. zg.B53]